MLLSIVRNSLPRLRNTLPLLLPLLLSPLVAAGSQADTLELKDGKSLSGTYAGGSSSNVRFTVSGSTHSYAADEIDALFFESRGDVAASNPGVKSKPADGPADAMDLRGGQSLNGRFAGGSSNNVRFNMAGTTKTYAVGEVEAIFFDRSGNGSVAAAAPAAAAPAPAAAPPPPAPAPAPAVVPAGSRIMVRNSQAIDSKRQQAGYRFTVRLESDLVAGKTVVAPRGANAYGVLTQAKKSGRVAGRSELTLTLTDIMIDNQLRPVITSNVQAVTDNTAGQSAKRTLGAAAIGGLISGRSGAKTGAAVGLGASILTSGKSINIPAGTLLEFRLGQPFEA
jgi:hypothetical protein